MVHRSGGSPAFLGKEGTTQTGPGQRLASREHRHALKVAQRALTEAKAGRLCMMATGTGWVTVSVGRSLIAHVSGVHRCGSIWVCPLCSPVVRQGRARDIDQGASVVLAGGGSGLFLTATGPHRKGDALGPLFDLCCSFVTLTMTGAKARELRRRLGYIGSIRAIEVTYGRPPFDNGWHPHVHVLMLFDRVLTPAEVADFRSFVFGRWDHVLRSRGFRGLHPVKGLDVRPVHDAGGLSEYLTAVEDGWGVGLEMARSDLKHRGLTPMELLASWALGGDLEARALWKEYEAVTFGRRCIQWTPGLRRRLLPEVEELSDDELAAAEGHDEQLVVFTFAGQDWNVWCRAGEVAVVLRQAEEAAALLLFLASFGVQSQGVAV